MIEIKDLQVIYDDQFVAIDHLQVELTHHHYCLIGENGSGKSTLLQTLVGLLAFQGEIIIDDVPLDDAHKGIIRQKVGLVFQNPDHQLFMSRIYDDLAFGLINQGYPQAEIDQKIQDIAQRFGIESLLARSCHQLSAGQKRLVAILTVLIMEPDIILMDEPSSFLDPKSRRSLIHFIQKLDKTLLIATHDLDMALEVSDEVLLLHEGKLVVKGDTDEILHHQKLLEDHGLELPYCLTR